MKTHILDLNATEKSREKARTAAFLDEMMFGYCQFKVIPKKPSKTST